MKMDKESFIKQLTEKLDYQDKYIKNNLEKLDEKSTFIIYFQLPNQYVFIVPNVKIS
jgi:ABC-type microcin C transport system permease subunit YejE